MTRLFLIVASVVTVGLFCLVFFAWHAVSKFLEDRRQRQLAELESYNKRLQYVVERLLARVDDIDQEQKYLGQPVSAETSKRLASTCTELVTLGDSLKLVDTMLEARDVHQSRRTLLRCCRIAAHVASELNHVRAIGVKDSAL